MMALATRMAAAMTLVLAVLLGPFTATPAMASEQPATAVAAAAGPSGVDLEAPPGDSDYNWVDGCQEEGDWWGWIWGGSGKPDCQTELDWPWEAGDAECIVAMGGSPAVPELVNCTGTSAENTGSMLCWVGVPTNTDGIAADSTTLCTTSTDTMHRDTLNATMSEHAELFFECDGMDNVCKTFEEWSRGLASDSISTLVTIITQSNFSAEGPLWEAAAGEWSYWVWAVIGILIIAFIWGVVASMFSKDRSELVGVIVRTVVTIPAIMLTFWIGAHALETFDQWTMYTLTRGETMAGVFRRFSQLIYGGGVGHYFMAWALMVVVWIGTKLLIIVFALRSIGLAALLMAGPAAWMMFPVKSIGPQWVVRYFSAAFTLLLSGPLMMGFVMLIMRGLGNLNVLWAPEAWPLLLGLLLTVFAPFAIMSMFSFAGSAAVDGLGGQLGNAGRSGMGAARNAGRSIAGGAKQSWAKNRANAKPAGVGPGGGQGGGKSGATPAPAGRQGSGTSAAASKPSSQPTSRSTPKPAAPTPTPTPAGSAGGASR